MPGHELVPLTPKRHPHVSHKARQIQNHHYVDEKGLFFARIERNSPHDPWSRTILQRDAILTLLELFALRKSYTLSGHYPLSGRQFHRLTQFLFIDRYTESRGQPLGCAIQINILSDKAGIHCGNKHLGPFFSSSHFLQIGDIDKISRCILEIRLCVSQCVCRQQKWEFWVAELAESFSPRSWSWGSSV